MPKRYPPEFRRKVLDLVDAGRPVAQVATDLDISEQTIYFWRRQHRIDRGQLPGPTSGEKAELMAARKRIAELETELAIHRRATELLGRWCPQKTVRGHRRDGLESLPVQVACRVLGVSESGYYDWRYRPPSRCAAVDPARLADRADPRRPSGLVGTYGARRVHAELGLGRASSSGTARWSC